MKILFFIGLISLLGPLTTWANLCEERAFQAGSYNNSLKELFNITSVFVKTAQKKGLLRTSDWDPNTLKELHRHTDHWTKEEVDVFFNFFIQKVGKKAFRERLKDLTDWALIEFNDFMEKKSFYDSLSPTIAPTVLKASFVGFRKIEDLTKLKEIIMAMEQYIDKPALVYLLKNLPLGAFFYSPSAKETLAFVYDYTTKHTPPAVFSVNWMQEPNAPKNIRLVEMKNPLSEKEPYPFDFDLPDKIRNQEFVPSSYKSSVEQILLSFRAYFSALLNAHVNELKETVRVLETYLPKGQISLMMGLPYIFNANPYRLQESINILKTSYDFQAQLTKKGWKHFSQQEHVIWTIKMQDFFKPPERNFKAFIRSLIAVYPENLLSVEEPYRLRAIIKILNKEMGKSLLALTFQNFYKDWVRDHFLDGLFSIESDNLQQLARGLSQIKLDPHLRDGMIFKANKAFIPNRPSLLGVLLWEHLSEIANIKEMEDFIRFIHIMYTHIVLNTVLKVETKSGGEKAFPAKAIFTLQLMDVIGNSDKISFELALQDITYLQNTFYPQMPELLVNNNVLDLIPSFRKVEEEKEGLDLNPSENRQPQAFNPPFKSDP